MEQVTWYRCQHFGEMTNLATDPGELRNLRNVPERQSLAASMLSRMIGFDRNILDSRPDRSTCA